MLPRTLLPLTFLLALLLAACAPRVSLRAAKTGAKSHTATRSPAKATRTPRRARARATPVKRRAPAKAAVAKKVVRRTVTPAPAPKKVVEDDYYDEDEDTGYAPPPPKVKKRDNYYAFTDVEISKLKRRNRRFRNLHARYDICSKQAARSIARREQIPEEIAKIRIEGLNRRAEKKIAKLRAEQARLTSEHQSTLTRCNDLEGQLTESLVEFYGTSPVAAR